MAVAVGGTSIVSKEYDVVLLVVIVMLVTVVLAVSARK